MESIETTSGVQANCTFDVAGHKDVHHRTLTEQWHLHVERSAANVAAVHMGTLPLVYKHCFEVDAFVESGQRISAWISPCYAQL